MQSYSSIYVPHSSSIYSESFDTIMRGSRGGKGGLEPSKKSPNIGFHSNTGLDPLKNHKATKPAFNFGSSSAGSLAKFTYFKDRERVRKSANRLRGTYYEI